MARPTHRAHDPVLGLCAGACRPGPLGLKFFLTPKTNALHSTKTEPAPRLVVFQFFLVRLGIIYIYILVVPCISYTCRLACSNSTYIYIPSARYTYIYICVCALMCLPLRLERIVLFLRGRNGAEARTEFGAWMTITCCPFSLEQRSSSERRRRRHPLFNRTISRIHDQTNREHLPELHRPMAPLTLLKSHGLTLACELHHADAGAHWRGLPRAGR